MPGGNVHPGSGNAAPAKTAPSAWAARVRVKGSSSLSPESQGEKEDLPLFGREGVGPGTPAWHHSPMTSGAGISREHRGALCTSTGGRILP